MNPDKALERWSRIFMIGAGFVIIVAGLRTANDLVAPFLLASFLAVICGPPLYWLQDRGVPKGLAVLMVVLGFVSIWIFFGAIVTNSLLNFKEDLPAYQLKLEELAGQGIDWLAAHDVEINDDDLRSVYESINMMSIVRDVVGQLGSFVGNAFMILLTAIFILLEQSTFPAKLRSSMRGAESKLEHVSEMTENVRRYLAIKTTICCLTGVLITILCWAIGIDYPILWGVMALMLNYVPTIGSYIAAIPAVLLALVQLGFGACFATIAGYAAVNVIIGNVIEPRITGRGLNISPLVVFCSLIFWGWVLGIVGALLSVPLTMILKIILESREDTRWIAVLLSGYPDESDPKSA